MCGATPHEVSVFIHLYFIPRARRPPQLTGIRFRHISVTHDTSQLTTTRPCVAAGRVLVETRGDCGLGGRGEGGARAGGAGSEAAGARPGRAPKIRLTAKNLEKKKSGSYQRLSSLSGLVRLVCVRAEQLVLRRSLVCARRTSQRRED